ncbi:early nodulin-like protein 1 [Canna indica]|uniref:Early nodulin-like protein 1 n=1 Tax=Canna indica TaxID=4628 RepID=A0AAQ3KQC8_9LILI|nr:early nodulin-like protein 1 [Canna indica]
MLPFCILRASFQIWALLLLLLQQQQQQNGCWCYQYQNHHFRLGDSLLFLYPPSQDSVVQVTERAFNSCSVEDPILRLDDGNSGFNITAPGYYYFISGVAGHCEKNQKLVVAVSSANGTFFPPAADGSAFAPGGSQTYPVVFGPTPAQVSNSPAARASVAIGAAAALLFGFALV